MYTCIIIRINSILNIVLIKFTVFNRAVANIMETFLSIAMVLQSVQRKHSVQN